MELNNLPIKLIPDSFEQDEIRAANESIDRQRTTKINNLNREIEKGRNLLNTLTERINNINNLEAQYNALDFDSRNLPGNIATMNDARQKKAQLEEGIRDINNQMRNIELDKNRINTEANSMKAQNSENRIKKRDELRQEIKENIPLLLEKYDEFNNYYHHPSQIDQTKFPFFQKIVDCAISISTPVIENGQNSTSIRGGCLIRSQKSCNIINQELSIEDEQNIDECVRNGKDFIALHGKKGFLVNFKLQSHKYSLVPFSESNESSCIKEFIQKYGFTMEHLELFSGIVNSSLSRMTLHQLNSKTMNNVSGASLACCNGSINSIDLFIKKGQDFGEVQ
ncbi:hypothetical protein M9Y10_035635 [Tritrichomonas musculus]|uniref:Uncharacterized protein n=1 Tax=Tritrichomonas musculus TaxID=1915356 RepID=A0ABR2GWA2_9EUKA